MENGFRVRVAVGCVTLAATFATAATATAAEDDFTARGSAEQVYATGLAPNAKVKLLDKKGKKVASKPAGEQGGVVFRKVKPGNGYTVSAKGEKSGALTVFTTKSAPPDEKVYDQDIASSGYQYMTMRDGTKLAINVHPSTDVTNAAGVIGARLRRHPSAHPDRVRGLRLRQPRRPAERDLDHRQPDGLHRRRREHARHRLLGRFL